MVHRIWPKVKPLLEPAFDEGCDATIEVTEADVLSGVAFLWVAWDGWQIVAAVTTALDKTPRHKMCVVTSAGGVGARLADQFMPMIEQYARAEACDLVRVMGRKGWAKILNGYEQPWIVLDKRLK